MFTKYESGAEVDIEEVYRYADGAEVEAEGVYRYVDGAEEAVWEAIKYMLELANTLPSDATVGVVTNSVSGDSGWGIWYFGGNTGGGSATYYLEGDFSNPTISFDYDGFFIYFPGDTATYATVGKIELYTRTTDGTEAYTTAVGSIKVTEGTESYSTELSGDFDRVGFRFTFQNWNVSSDYSPQYLFNIWNILIDGKDCLPS